MCSCTQGLNRDSIVEGVSLNFAISTAAVAETLLHKRLDSSGKLYSPNYPCGSRNPTAQKSPEVLTSSFLTSLAPVENVY